MFCDSKNYYKNILLLGKNKSSLLKPLYFQFSLYKAYFYQPLQSMCNQSKHNFRAESEIINNSVKVTNFEVIKLNQIKGMILTL